jgi:competence protein ComEA
MSWRLLGLSLSSAVLFSWGWIHLEPLLFPVSEAKVQLAAVQPATIIQPRAQVLITGGVKHPGIYHLPKGALIYDLVQQAGGLSATAHIPAALLSQVIPERGEVKIPELRQPEAQEDQPRKPTRKRKKQKSTLSDHSLELNRATLAELDQLPGVGPKMAERIIAWRTEHGGFQQIEDLRKVKGIGAKRWQELRRYLR